MRLINLGPIVVFSIFKLTTSSGKHLENINHAHIVSLLYKLLTSAEKIDALFICIDRSRDRRKHELTNNKNIIGEYHLGLMLKDIFGFAQHQQKATFALKYKLTLTRNKDKAVLDKVVGIADARIKIDHIHWDVAHYTSAFQQQGVLSEQILRKTPTELRYIEGSLPKKEVNNQNLWNFELSSQEIMNVPIWIIIRVQ